MITGKEALIALANGEEVETKTKGELTWSAIGFFAVNIFKDENWEFRLKPHTITINGIEVPEPFKPKIGEYVYFISSDDARGYAETTLIDTEVSWGFVQFGAWRTEEEIKQVVAALRSIFK